MVGLQVLGKGAGQEPTAGVTGQPIHGTHSPEALQHHPETMGRACKSPGAAPHPPSGMAAVTSQGTWRRGHRACGAKSHSMKQTSGRC